MDTQTALRNQVAKHQTRLRLATRPVTRPATPGPQILRPLSTPAFLVSARSKRGHVRSIVMHNHDSAVMLARTHKDHAFSVMAKLRRHGKWEKYTTFLSGGPLHRSLNTASEFLRDNGEPWMILNPENERHASDGALEVLERFKIAQPNHCTANICTALILASQFARAFDAAFGTRPWINGREAREITFEKLKNSQ